MKNRTSKYGVILIILIILIIGVWIITRSYIQDKAPTKDMRISNNQHSQIHTDKDTRSYQIRENEIIRNSNAPIEFWGITLDESGKPLGSVQIQWGTDEDGHFDMAVNKHGKSGRLQSDEDGKFYINAGSGSVLGLDSMVKEGYILSKCEKEFGYANVQKIYKPDKNNPQQFIFTQIEKLPTLIHYKRKYTLKWDQKAISYDLMNGNISMTGDLIITASIKNANISSDYDWTFSARVKDGGVLQTSAFLTTIAPNKDYEPIWECGAQHERLSGRDRNYLFIRTADGKYGLLHLSIFRDSSQNVKRFDIEAWLNQESGNRILERNGAKIVEVK